MSNAVSKYLIRMEEFKGIALQKVIDTEMVSVEHDSDIDPYDEALKKGTQILRERNKKYKPARGNSVSFNGTLQI